MKRASLILLSASIFVGVVVLTVWLGVESIQTADLPAINAAAASTDRWNAMVRYEGSALASPVESGVASHVESASTGRWNALARHYFAASRAVMTRSYAPSSVARAEFASANRWDGMARKHYAAAQSSANRWNALARHDVASNVVMTRSYASSLGSRAELATADRLSVMNSHYISSQTEAERWKALARHDASSQAQALKIIPVTGGSASAFEAVLSVPVQEMAAFSAADASAHHWNLMIQYYTNQP